MIITVGLAVVAFAVALANDVNKTIEPFEGLVLITSYVAASEKAWAEHPGAVSLMKALDDTTYYVHLQLHPACFLNDGSGDMETLDFGEFGRWIPSVLMMERSDCVACSILVDHCLTSAIVVDFEAMVEERLQAVGEVLANNMPDIDEAYRHSATVGMPSPYDVMQSLYAEAFAAYRESIRGVNECSAARTQLEGAAVIFRRRCKAMAAKMHAALIHSVALWQPHHAIPSAKFHDEFCCQRYEVLTQLLRIIDGTGHGDLLVAEIGVCSGATSYHLLKELPQLHLLSIDPYLTEAPVNPQDGQWDDKNLWCDFDATKSKLSRFGRRSLLWISSSGEAAQMFHGSLDLVFVDGDHSYDAVISDIRAWAPKVRAGGIVAGVFPSMARL